MGRKITVAELMNILESFPDDAVVTVGNINMDGDTTHDVQRITHFGASPVGAIPGPVIVGVSEDGRPIRNFANPNEVVLS